MQSKKGMHLLYIANTNFGQKKIEEAIALSKSRVPSYKK